MRRAHIFEVHRQSRAKRWPRITAQSNENGYDSDRKWIGRELEKEREREKGSDPKPENQ